MTVYQIRNTINGRRYIGGTTRHPKRIYQHKTELRAGIHGNAELQGDYNLYGEKFFAYEIIAQCESITDLRRREMQEIQSHLQGYNVRGVRCEPANEIGGAEWIAEMQGIIDGVRGGKKLRAFCCLFA